MDLQNRPRGLYARRPLQRVTNSRSRFEQKLAERTMPLDSKLDRSPEAARLPRCHRPLPPRLIRQD